jgi:hypothetical protein
MSVEHFSFFVFTILEAEIAYNVVLATQVEAEVGIGGAIRPFSFSFSAS